MALAFIIALTLRLPSSRRGQRFSKSANFLDLLPPNCVSQRSATATPYLLLPPPPPRYSFTSTTPASPRRRLRPTRPPPSTRPLARPPARLCNRSRLPCQGQGHAAPRRREHCSQSVRLGLSAGAFTVRVRVGRERESGAVQSVCPAKVLYSSPSLRRSRPLPPVLLL